MVLETSLPSTVTAGVVSAFICLGGISCVGLLLTFRTQSPRGSLGMSGWWQALRVFLVYAQAGGYLIQLMTLKAYSASPLSSTGTLTLAVAVLLGAVGPLHILEVRYSDRALTALLGVWLGLTLVTGFAALRASVDGLAINLLQSTYFLVSATLLGLEAGGAWTPIGVPRRPNLVERYYTYTWLNPMMARASHGPLILDDVPLLPPSVEEGLQLSTLWAGNSNKLVPSLFPLLVKFLLPHLCVVALLELVQCLALFAQPLLLKALIKLFESHATTKPAMQRGLTLAGAMFVVSLGTSLLTSLTQVKTKELGFRCKSGLLRLVYAKGLKAPCGLGGFSITTIMAIDAANIQTLVEATPLVVSIPIKLAVSFMILHSLIGSSFVVSFAVIPAMLYVGLLISRQMERLYTAQMEAKDLRGALTLELFLAIRSVKLYGWETAIEGKIQAIRHFQELPVLRAVGRWDAIGNCTWTMAPVILSLSVLMVFVFLKGAVLTPDVVFPAMSVLGLLSLAFYQIPSLLSAASEGRVAYMRVLSYLTDPNIDLPENGKGANPIPGVVVGNASFLWEEPLFALQGELLVERSTVALTDISMEIRPGTLTCLVGPIGSGKSACIRALAGQLPLAITQSPPPVFKRSGTVAYVPQDPWILNASLRANILFGSSMDEDFYAQTLAACALLPDLEKFSLGDLTVVGESGMTLSGGQRSRVALARAVYSRADVYLVDDVLSAVDAHVAQYLIANVFSAEGILGSRVRVFATHNMAVLAEANQICRFAHGKLVATESPLGAVSTASSLMPNPPKADRAPPVLLLAEDQAVGSVSLDVYLAYIRTFGLSSAVVVGLLVALWPCFQLLGGYWLKLWSEKNLVQGMNVDPWFNLGVYAAIGAGLGGTTLVRSLLMRVQCGPRASQKLHDAMLRAVVRAPMAFFSQASLGQILNRFTLDLNRVDDGLSRTAENCVEVCCEMLFILIVIVWALPPMIAIMGGLGLLFYYYQTFYTAATRLLTRLSSSTRSPLMAHVQETMAGVESVRVYQKEAWFSHVHASNLTTNLRVDFLAVLVALWLSVRLKALGAVVVFFVTLLCVHSLTTATLGPGTVGFIVSNTLYLSTELEEVVTYVVNTELRFVAVERVLQYCQILPEPVMTTKLDITRWPLEGRVTFSGYSTRYAEEPNLALRRVSLDIKPGEKVGIVGRTGAGKSTLVLALFRTIEATEGQITIDGVVTTNQPDVSLLSLLDLRRGLGIIPQTAHMFQGTLRYNLDPFNRYTDDEVWECAKLAQLNQRGQLGGVGGDGEACVHPGSVLAFPITESGGNLSGGQKQLVCLARALLHASPILVVDEATSSVDPTTDLIVQQAITTRFPTKTIVTIAHRLAAVRGCDRIVVLEAGEIVELDTPDALLRNANSRFSKMWAATGLAPE